MSITKTPTSMIDPNGATAGQVLTFNGSTSTWAASAVPNPASFYTTVGNASAGIFANAVCFIPSDPGTGTWTAPAGCYTARVTIVGGGGGSDTTGGNGTRSHFNYPSGSTTSANQMFADGGKNNTNGRLGGSAGWNGVNNIAIGGGGIDSTSYGSGGYGGFGGGGVGGGGGAGNPTTPNAGNLGGGGGSFGSGGNLKDNSGCGAGSGGINGRGNSYGTESNSGGGAPTLSYAAYNLNNFITALTQKINLIPAGVGHGLTRGGGGGWCSAIVSVVPGQSYTYEIGTGGLYSGSIYAAYGMVMIEW